MRGTAVQKYAAEDNGDGPRVGFTELAFMHQHHIALKSCPNREVGRKDGGSVSSAMTEKARCGRVQWKAFD